MLQRYWRANTPGSVDVATLEGLLEEQRTTNEGDGRRRKAKKSSRKGKKSKELSMGSVSENGVDRADSEDTASQASSHHSEIV